MITMQEIQIKDTVPQLLVRNFPRFVVNFLIFTKNNFKRDIEEAVAPPSYYGEQCSKATDSN